MLMLTNMAKSQTLEDFREFLKERGAVIIDNATSPFSPMTIQCKRGHEWKDQVSSIYRGDWCPKCEEVPLKEEISSLLDEAGVEYRIDYHVPSRSFDIKVDWAIARGIDLLFVSLDHDIYEKLKKGGYKCVYAQKDDFSWISRLSSEETTTSPTTDSPLPSPPSIRGDMKPIGTAGKSFYKDIPFELDSCTPAVAYCRVSTPAQAQYGSSIEEQEDSILRHCYKNNIHLRRIYYDMGLSGGESKKRLAFCQMLEEVEEGDTIIAASSCRFSRNFKEAVKLQESLEERGVNLYFIEFSIDTSTADGKRIYDIMSTYASRQREEASERVSAVLNHMSATHKLRSKPLYGWKFVAKDKPFVQDEDEQRIIEKIRKWKEEEPRLTISNIRRRLIADGDRCRKAKDWHFVMIQRIMQQNKIPITDDTSIVINPAITR